MKVYVRKVRGKPKWVVKKKDTKDNKLVITIISIFGFVYLSTVV